MAKTKETPIQTDIMSMLAVRHDVAWAYVTSAGLFKGAGGRYYTMGVPGLPDIIGQLKSGRLLGIEVKFPGKKPDEDQYRFMLDIALNGGVSFWCCSAAEAADYLRLYCKYGL